MSNKPMPSAAFDLRNEIERLCRDAYERGAKDAVSSLVDAFQQVGMTDAARLAQDALPRLRLPVNGGSPGGSDSPTI